MTSRTTRRYFFAMAAAWALAVPAVSHAEKAYKFNCTAPGWFGVKAACAAAKRATGTRNGEQLT